MIFSTTTFGVLRSDMGFPFQLALT